MPTNNRVFYATQLIHLNPCDTTGDNPDGSAVSSDPTFYTPRAVQSREELQPTLILQKSLVSGS